jgi:hypothetical protein
MIRMKAVDSFYADDLKQVHGGAEFEVETEARAKQLEERKLAQRVVGGEEAKAAPAPDNKMAAEPANKTRRTRATK